MRQSHDTRTLLFAYGDAIFLTLLLILLLGGVPCTQFVIPVGLQGIGYQAVCRIDVQVASLSQIGLIPSTLHLLFTQKVHLIQPGLDLLLDLECNFQRQGGDYLDEKLADSLVDVLPQNALAYRNDMVGPFALTHILWSELARSHVVTNSHSAATNPTHSQALQQRRSLTWGTLSAIRAIGVSILPKPLQILLIFFPSDVTGMNILKQGPPLAGHLRACSGSVRLTSNVVSTKNECTRIARVVQDVQHAAVSEFCPHQLSFIRSLPQTPREKELFLAEGLDHTAGGTRAAEGVEQEPNAFLHLFVRIEDRPALAAIPQAHRQRALQFAAACFV